MFTAECKAIGLVFDISLRQLDGRRVVDQAKQQMASWLELTLEESEDFFYLYHPDIVEPTVKKGQSLSWLASYSTEGWLHDLRTALAQTYWVLAAQDMDARKGLIFITDRLQDSAPIDRLFLLERRERTGMRFVFVGIGQYYRKAVLDSFANQPTTTVGHLDAPTDLRGFLLSNIGRLDGSKD